MTDRPTTWDASDPDSVEYLAFLGRLAAAENPDLRAAAVELRRQWDARAAAAKTPAGAAPRPASTGVVFRPVELTVTAGSRPLQRPDGILSVGPGVDVVWGPGGLYLMKEKGRLRGVWSGDVQDGFSTVVFDGRYVWAAVRRSDRWPWLLALDPVAGKVWPVTAAHGLPEGTDDQLKRHGGGALQAAPLGPGRVCAAGSFGRAWIAVVIIDPATGTPAVKVIHEARVAQDQNNPDQGGQTTVDFSPAFMFTLRGHPGPGTKPGCRVLIGRRGPATGYGTANGGVITRPLLIDPDQPAVEVMRGEPLSLVVFSDASKISWTGDAVYFAEPDTGNKALRVFRIGWPDLTKNLVSAEIPPGTGRVAVHDGRLHVVRNLPPRPPRPGEPAAPGPTGQDREWWTVDLDGKGLSRVGTNIPNLRALSVSAHYGLVAVLSPLGDAKVVLHTVEFPPTPPR